MNDTARRVYSTRRLRIVVALLTLVFLPIVIGASLLIYQYMLFSVMVEQRLHGREGPAALARLRAAARPAARARPRRRRAREEAERPALRRARRRRTEAGPVLRAAAGRRRSSRGRSTDGARGDGHGLVRDRQAGIDADQGPPRRARRSATRSRPLEPELVTYMFDEDREKRRRVAFEEMPDHLVKAVLAIEDRRFFSHPGLDPLASSARAIRNMRSDSSIPYGGSTLTQQLCKNFFLTQVDERGYRVAERSYRRKAQEALLAFVLERRATKQEILELYLNEIYLGQSGSFGINGMGEAARIYFRKDVSNLTLPEAALLAGMIQSPNPYNPFRHEKRATERRNEVDPRDARGGLHRPGDDGGGARGAAPRRAAERRHDRRALLRRPRRPAARPALRPARTSSPRTSRSTRRSTCTSRRSPSRRSSAASTGSRR